MGIDLLSLTAHKMYGPKGIGALYVRSTKPRVKITGQIDGGGHERGMRSGTLNVPGIVGLGKACELAQKEMSAEGERLTALRERLKTGIFEQLDDVRINGDAVDALAGQSEHELRICRRRVSDDGAKGNRRVDRIGVHVRKSRAVLCAESDRFRRFVGSCLDSLWSGPVQYGRTRSTTPFKRVVEEVRRLREISPVYKAKKSQATKTPTSRAQAGRTAFVKALGLAEEAINGHGS